MPLQMQLTNGIGIGIYTGHWTGTIDSYSEDILHREGEHITSAISGPVEV